MFSLLEWVAMSSSGDLPNPGIEPRSPTLQADSLSFEPPGKPKNTGVGTPILYRGIEPGSPELQADSLPAELPGKPRLLYTLGNCIHYFYPFKSSANPQTHSSWFGTFFCFWGCSWLNVSSGNPEGSKWSILFSREDLLCFCLVPRPLPTWHHCNFIFLAGNCHAPAGSNYSHPKFQWGLPLGYSFSEWKRLFVLSFGFLSICSLSSRALWRWADFLSDALQQQA